MCGDKGIGLPPTKLYAEPYARKGVEEAEFLYQHVVKLLEELERHREAIVLERTKVLKRRIYIRSLWPSQPLGKP
ncbi:MAG: hypothetical protein QXV81_07580 [Ignisphaera sp.]